MKSVVTLVLLCSMVITTQAATTISSTFTLGIQVPDNTGAGLSDTRIITSTITSITRVRVQLSMRGGWAGDMYVSLLHDSGFAVLLNRPGRNLENPDGSEIRDIFVTFEDTAPEDIHTAMTSLGTLSGIYQPDAREDDPDLVGDTSERTAFLSSFNGLDANGEWTLFAADVSSGDQMEVESWTLEIQGVPEPSTSLIAVFSAIGLLRRRRSQI